MTIARTLFHVVPSHSSERSDAPAVSAKC